MEKIVNNSGLQHLVEKVFWNLDDEDLKICAWINQSCKQILTNPIFCLSKFEYLSKKNRRDWLNVIQSFKNSDKGIAVIFYLKGNLKKNIVDPPCYCTPAVQDDFKKKIWECCKKQNLSKEDTEFVKILAPLTDNPNTPNNIGKTPIYWAAYNGHTEIVKILAPLTDNANGPSWNGNTPIHWAARFGHTEIVKILVSLTDNPNAPNKSGVTPYEYAKKEIREILENFKTSKNHNQCRNTKQSMIV